jgi:restriction system protein
MTQSEEVRVWGIHTRDDALFLRDSVIAIGWRAMGDLRDVGGSRGAFKERYAEAYPNAKRGNVSVSAGILFRFACEARVGDVKVSPRLADRDCGGNLGPRKGYTEDRMYSTEQRKLAIEIYIKFDLSAADIVAQLPPLREAARPAGWPAAWSMVPGEGE